ncbi:hypothetical protein VT84_29970 [Gemmata sp. SH-PL17]|uniref:thioredoxin family protein n=1 Tax=Gemmata sp. SH-PL17 TaxID=1630693 RepID=UPI00078D48F1|nr:thioredoxin family protein [Gemmata sp. SH-PL17]AMV28670.1 hypothetical protein VT84_29970 [Gemmata sp. SH-PL17]
MTTTILAVIALSGSLVPAAKPEFQAQTDYSQALRQAAAEGKPMAVLIGNGNAFAKVMGDAALPEATAKLLRDKFVCVTVDVNTVAGKELAGQFQLTDGLVISSAGGTHQALRQSGSISTSDLTKHTATFANATGTPAMTVTVGAPYTVYPTGYSPVYRGTVIQGGCSGGSCGTVIQGCSGGSCGTIIQGGYSFPSIGSCPNGRCPTPR